MKDILEYLKVENVSHPSMSDIELGMNIEYKYSELITKFISNIFDKEFVNFTSNNNGIYSKIEVKSNKKSFEFILDKSNIKYVIREYGKENVINFQKEYQSITDFKKIINEQIKTI